MPPHPAINTPSGARMPKMDTDKAPSTGFRFSVTCDTNHNPMIPATTPHKQITLCAGVQKLSRPMERCQDTSHEPPRKQEVTASAPVHRYQGTPSIATVGVCRRAGRTAPVVENCGVSWAAEDIALVAGDSSQQTTTKFPARAPNSSPFLRLTSHFGTIPKLGSYKRL